MAWASFAAEGAKDLTGMATAIATDVFDLNKPKTELHIADPGSNISPSLLAGQFENLLQFGLVDPASLVQSGPAGRFAAEMSATPSLTPGHKSVFAGWIADAVRQWQQTGRYTPPEGAEGREQGEVFARLIQQFAGYSSVEQFLQAETDYQAQIQPMVEQAQAIGGENFASRMNIMNQLNQLFAGPEVFGAERDRQLERINRNLNEQEQRALAVANAGNFNPGGALEQFANLRSDADMDAMARAMSIIGGQASILQGALSPAQQNAQQLAAIEMGTGSAGMMANTGVGTNPNVAGALQNLGSGIPGAIQGMQDQRMFNQWLASQTPGPAASSGFGQPNISETFNAFRGGDRLAGSF
jgi:hypothetical protein